MSRERLEKRFAELKAEGRSAFVAYVMGGDPDAETALQILKGLPAAGADVIELGFAFSDPMADGPLIQRAAQRALKAGATLNGTLELVRRFREHDQTTPLILMGYLNPLLTHGLKSFAADAAAAGMDGIIVVDAPPEESQDLDDALAGCGLSRIWLATPTTDDERLKLVLKGASGFVYYVSVTGVTGVKEADAGAVAPHVARIRAASSLPVAVGFGIRTPERASAVARVADGVVVGSALVEEIAEALERNETPAPKVLELARRLAQAVREARVNAAV
jgi:tryptophan synthase alpha chain